MRYRILSGRPGAARCWLPLLLVALGASATFMLADATSVPAQAAEEEKAAAEPAADAGLEDEILDEEPATGADTAPAEEDTQQKRPSRLKWMYDSLGVTYSIVFLGLSFTLVALFVMNILTARRESVVPASLVEGFEEHLDEKRYQDAYEMAKNDESFLGQVLSAGLVKLSAGYDQAIEAMQEVGEDENMKLEHRLSYMALIGTVSPMVGLLGTVHGMINAFTEIALAGGAPKPQVLAMGISKALFTTLLGLIIAIPAIAAYNILRNRVARLVLEVGILSESLMGRFSNVGAKKS